MEHNKENTGIPVPEYPLPPIPDRLIRKYKKPIPRIPLCTLNGQKPSAAGPSKTKPRLIHPSSNTPLNTTYVIVARGNQCLDRDLELSDYQEPTKSVESGLVEADQSDAFNKAFCEENVNEESRAEQANATYVTVRKCEQSLDRDLEDLDYEEPTGSDKIPANKTKLAKSATSENNSSLQYQQLSEPFNPPDATTIQMTECLLTSFEPDILDHLLKSEKRAPRRQLIHNSARVCIVNWLMEVNGPDGNPAVLQTACWFFDAITGQRPVPTEQLYLKASACFWIAQKLYQQAVISAIELAELSDNSFLESQLMDAEWEVLNILGFPRQPVVPQDFISFFAWTCNKEYHRLIEMTATFFAMCGLLFHTDYCSELPSVVAAAAVKNACICLEDSDLEAKLESCPWYKKAEEKAVSFKRTCSAQRSAVRRGALPFFEYNAPYRHYGQPPLCLAQRMVKVTAELATLDAAVSSSSYCCLL